MIDDNNSHAFDPKKRLSEKEEAIMRIVWTLGKAFVKEVWEDLPETDVKIAEVAFVFVKRAAEGGRENCHQIQ